VEAVRSGAQWQIRHRGTLVAEHCVLTGRHQLSVLPEHGPGAVARNARKRHGQATPGGEPVASAASALLGAVEQRDLAVYEQMLEAA
jgi:hypothetical protein